MMKRNSALCGYWFWEHGYWQPCYCEGETSIDRHKWYGDRRIPEAMPDGAY